MARGKRPATFRTRKLSLSAPMVLPRGRGGRVGRRRTNLHERAPATRLGPFRIPTPALYRDKARAVKRAKAPGSAAAGFLRGGADVVGQPRVERVHLTPAGTHLVQR